ncbi:peptide chain release factor N(5)-glutamine methyltransferase [uncultured Roseivirga sp.]|uniref:peptide chain release factor N(5)-glutamine methyltransferase n=1 Tax=uncultured Roseivirga sp. TaxID=543088 RepID=UPI0030DA86B8|tara:strand:- start:27 stop:887 length:861 start_codon:yes stop_codon:yes gene_type:complete
MPFEKPKAKIQAIAKKLSGVYDEREAMNMAHLLLTHFYGLDRMKVVLNDEFLLVENVEIVLNKATDELNQHKPIQHILGSVEFYGCELKVDERALIPRPETEELVDWIVTENIIEDPYILDVGTGTGCIPIALKNTIPKARVVAVDVSEEALALARENAKQNNTEVDFQHLDILNEAFPFDMLDLVVSNPPYIPESDKPEMSSNVLSFEPHLALFVANNDPFIFYKRITELALQHLKIGGMLYFEIHERFGEEMVKLVEDMGFTNVFLKKDLQGKDRMLQAQKYYI